MDERAVDALRFMLQRQNLLRAEDIPRVVIDAAELIGASSAVIYLVDLHQDKLIPFAPEQSGPLPSPINVDGTLAGRAYAQVSRQVRRSGSAITTWEPLLDGTERVGVLELSFPMPGDQARIELEGRHLASLIAEMIVARQKYGDAIVRSRRLLPMQLPAEMQWQLMPPLTFATPDVVVSGTIEPAYEVGGDCFDYSVNGTTAHVAVIDAMGHGLGAPRCWRR